MGADHETAAAVDVREVVKSFGDKPVLRGITWDIPPASICGLLGPNGAGKTTLFRLLMGILKPEAGSIHIAGLDAFDDRVPLKRLIGFVPDEPVFYNYLKGREVIELSAAMHDLDLDEMWRRIDPLVERLEMAAHLDAYAEEYSRGMKKKLGLILALLHQPSILILDEPTNGLDVTATRSFFELMREQAAAGHAVIFSTHLMDQVERLCEHVAIIHGGKIVLAGRLREILGGRTLEDVFCESTAS
ncbi:ABC transporter ATP-binding protein [Haloferula sargassicola]|uniref:ABC-type transporter ATP-binding protein EcsA n=1 Tax=Haloferula sargassicola TaxID=490096 RepID=A0ABP9UHK5_9BACT